MFFPVLFIFLMILRFASFHFVGNFSHYPFSFQHLIYCLLFYLFLFSLLCCFPRFILFWFLILASSLSFRPYTLYSLSFLFVSRLVFVASAAAFILELALLLYAVFLSFFLHFRNRIVSSFSLSFI